MYTSDYIGFAHRITVGVADTVVCNNPTAILCTHGLGSCIGLSVYDPLMKVGGLLHAMLPYSGVSPHKASAKPGIFLDTGLNLLLNEVADLNADLDRLKVCAAGAAQILDADGPFTIGASNYETLLRLLSERHLPLNAQHIGGLMSRSMALHLATGAVHIKLPGVAKEILL